MLSLSDFGTNFMLGSLALHHKGQAGNLGGHVGALPVFLVKSTCNLVHSITCTVVLTVVTRCRKSSCAARSV